MSAKSAGYPGTPLARKLGISRGTRLLTRRAPQHYASLLEPLPDGVVFQHRLSRSTDIVHVFSTRCAQLEGELPALRKAMREDAALWVSWPKKSAKVPTDIGENTIRELALPLGLVDVKVCAVDETWSGLKLVVRRELR